MDVVHGNEAVVEGQEAEVAETGELELVREVVLRAHPDVVPELVTGGTVAELLASVEPARAAYARIVAGQPVEAEASVVVPPVVPAGAGTSAVDPATLPAQELIRRGVAAERRRGGRGDGRG